MQRARNGTWDTMRKKKESETEPVRRLATSRAEKTDESVQETHLTLSDTGSGERRAI